MTTVSSPSTNDASVDRPPEQKLSPADWIQRNLFDSWISSILTLVSAAILFWVITNFGNWAFNQANWSVVSSNLKIFTSGTYPREELWRVWLVLGLVMATLGSAGGAWGGVLRQYMLGLGILFGIGALLPFGEAQALMGGASSATFAVVALTWNRQVWRLGSIFIWALLSSVALELLLGGSLPQLRTIRAE